MKSILLIDGENVKGKIREVLNKEKLNKINWSNFDFKNMFNKALHGYNIDKKVFYFARIKEHLLSIEKSKKLINEQRLLKNQLEKQGFEVVLKGRVVGQGNSNSNIIFKEKGVDVKIAIDMVTLACDKKVETIYLCSSDSDLQPAIEEVNKRNIESVYVGFEQNPNKGMSYNSKRTILIRNKEVLDCRSIQNQLI